VILLVMMMVLTSGCTIHFKGENLEMDVERQRVFRFDGVTFTDWAFYDRKTEKNGSRYTYRIQSVGFLDPQTSPELKNLRKFITAKR